MMKTTNTLMTEIKDLNEGRDILFINWNKLSVLPELLYRFTAIQSKFQQDFFIEIDKLVLKFIWKNKNSTIAKAILTKKSKVGFLDSV